MMSDEYEAMVKAGGAALWEEECQTRPRQRCNELARDVLEAAGVREPPMAELARLREGPTVNPSVAILVPLRCCGGLDTPGRGITSSWYQSGSGS